MDENFVKNRHTWYALFLTLAIYGGMYVLSRAGGMIITNVSPEEKMRVEQDNRAAVARLDFPRRTFLTAYPPLLWVFFPAVWLESRFPHRF